MKKTSRRSFGKQLTGAIAALPIASLATKGIAGQMDPKKASRVSVQKTEKEHDTPPPLFIQSGSLILEARTDKNDWTHTPMPGSRRGYRVLTKDRNDQPPTTAIFVAHIKIVDGSGELVYRFDNYNNTTKSVPVHVNCLMNGDLTENFHLSVDNTEFVIDVPDKRKIKPKQGDPVMNGKRKRVKYLNDQGSDSHDITTIQIVKGPRVLYQVDRSDLGKGADEMRIMVWWEVQ
jgi:hypothetical protein